MPSAGRHRPTEPARSSVTRPRDALGRFRSVRPHARRTTRAERAATDRPRSPTAQSSPAPDEPRGMQLRSGARQRPPARSTQPPLTQQRNLTARSGQPDSAAADGQDSSLGTRIRLRSDGGSSTPSMTPTPPPTPSLSELRASPVPSAPLRPHQLLARQSRPCNATRTPPQVGVPATSAVPGTSRRVLSRRRPRDLTPERSPPTARTVTASESTPIACMKSLSHSPKSSRRWPAPSI